MSWENIKINIENKYAIEMGGPTILFQESMLIYDKISVDGINLKDNNQWQNVGDVYKYYNKTGKQFVGDCVDENIINSIQQKYDLILTSHHLEHVANPIKALKLWLTLLNKDGKILCIIPNKEHFWDSVRNYTTLEHLIEDYENNTLEDDLTHLNENYMTDVYNSERFPDYKDKAKENIKHRIMHHHCFNIELVVKMMEYSGYKTIYSFVYDKDPLQLVYFGQKK